MPSLGSVAMSATTMLRTTLCPFVNKPPQKKLCIIVFTVSFAIFGGEKTNMNPKPLADGGARGLRQGRAAEQGAGSREQGAESRGEQGAGGRGEQGAM